MSSNTQTIKKFIGIVIMSCTTLDKYLNIKMKYKINLVVVSKVTQLHVFFEIVVIKVLLHPAHVTPVEIPVAFTLNSANVSN